MNIFSNKDPVIQNVRGGITLLNMDGFSKFKNWETAKNQENLFQ